MHKAVWFSVVLLTLVVILSIVTAALPSLLRFDAVNDVDPAAPPVEYFHIGAFLTCLQIPPSDEVALPISLYACESLLNECKIFPKLTDDSLSLNNCTQFNAMRAFLVMGIIFAFISLILVVVALIYALKFSYTAGCLRLSAIISTIVMTICFFLSFFIAIGYANNEFKVNDDDGNLVGFSNFRVSHTTWTLLASFFLSIVSTVVYFLFGKPDAEEAILGGLPTYLQY